MREGLWIVTSDTSCFGVWCFEHPFPDVLHGSHAFQGISIGIVLTGALVLLGCLSSHAQSLTQIRSTLKTVVAAIYPPEFFSIKPIIILYFRFNDRFFWFTSLRLTYSVKGSHHVG